MLISYLIIIDINIIISYFRYLKYWIHTHNTDRPLLKVIHLPIPLLQNAITLNYRGNHSIHLLDLHNKGQYNHHYWQNIHLLVHHNHTQYYMDDKSHHSHNFKHMKLNCSYNNFQSDIPNSDYHFPNFPHNHNNRYSCYHFVKSLYCINLKDFDLYHIIH